MALIVETGSALANAESYCSVADFKSYHTARGRGDAVDLLEDETIEQNLRLATDYMLQRYRPRWKGTRMTSTQTLDWPRGDVYTLPFRSGAYLENSYLVPNNVVPTAVRNACAELAYKAQDGTLWEDTARRTVREQVGTLAVEYDRYAPTAKQYPSIDATLAEFLLPGGVVTPVVRT